MEWLDSTSKDLIYREAGSRQIMFVRDTLARALAESREQWEGAVTVISEHRSKSVRLPVYRVALPGLELVMRDNFHNWAVSVRREKPDDVGGWGLFDEKAQTSGCYCEGFPDGSVFGPYALNRRQFTVHIWGGTHDLYAFCLLLGGKR